MTVFCIILYLALLIKLLVNCNSVFFCYNVKGFSLATFTGKGACYMLFHLDSITSIIILIYIYVNIIVLSVKKICCTFVHWYCSKKQNSHQTVRLGNTMQLVPHLESTEIFYSYFVLINVQTEIIINKIIFKDS